MVSSRETRPHNHYKHQHNHEHERITKVDSQVPDFIYRFIALEEALAHKGLITIDETRLKKDEYMAKGLMKGKAYYERRFTSFREVLKDRMLVTQEEIGSKILELGEQYRKHNISVTPLEHEINAIAELILSKNLLSIHQFGRKYSQVKSRSVTNGGRVVARAWVDPSFKARLLADAKSAIMSLDPLLLAPDSGETVDTWIQAVENTEKVRNIVVCTLCSCYPRGLLGEPPEWYTSDSYKEKVITDPKNVLEERGVKVGKEMQIQVFDSTADTRYMVIPMRPIGTEGMTEEELAKLVTRDSLIGVADALSPKELRKKNRKAR
jgi:hypothetical protein